MDPLSIMVRPAGLEPATYGLEGRCSIRLSYGRLELHSCTDQGPKLTQPARPGISRRVMGAEGGPQDRSPGSLSATV